MESPVSNASGPEWFSQSKYGLFIHWGPYSVAGRGEWVANREKISFQDYKRLYADSFRAEHYDPSAWASLAVEAGMGYAVLTARHHDGFALWPTETSDFHAGALGPKMDLVERYVTACRSAGLRVGLYFSPADWFHYDYPGAHFRDWPSPKDWKSEEARARFIEYYRAQLRELMTNYGTIDYLWFDGCIPQDLQCREANEEALRLQPHLLINDRNGPPSHVRTCEQTIQAPDGAPIWEACMTLNESWGYHSGDFNWKHPTDVIKMLIKTVSQGGNLLLNVGPRADGIIPEPSQTVLRDAGRWLKENGHSIYGANRSPFTWAVWGAITVRHEKIFLHIWNFSGGEMCVCDIRNTVHSAYLLEGGRIACEQDGEYLRLIGIPAPKNGPILTVVLEVDGNPRTTSEQISFWIPG